MEFRTPLSTGSAQSRQILPPVHFTRPFSTGTSLSDRLLWANRATPFEGTDSLDTPMLSPLADNPAIYTHHSSGSTHSYLRYPGAHLPSQISNNNTSVFADCSSFPAPPGPRQAPQVSSARRLSAVVNRSFSLPPPSNAFASGSNQAGFRGRGSSLAPPDAHWPATVPRSNPSHANSLHEAHVPSTARFYTPPQTPHIQTATNGGACVQNEVPPNLEAVLGNMVTQMMNGIREEMAETRNLFMAQPQPKKSNAVTKLFQQSSKKRPRSVERTTLIVSSTSLLHCLN